MNAEVAALLIVTNLGTAAASTFYFIRRCDDRRLACQERIAQANAEITAQRDMVRRAEMQARVMGSVPVSRLIGGDDV